MMTLRRANDRGQTNLGWLDSKHTFSFGHYYDPKHMGFSVLRVVNDDIVLPNRGFGTHPHDNMEILSYVVEGQLAHRDSMGTGSTITAGELQRMSAGSGLTHSEFNPSETQPVRFLQIWILPEKRNVAPSYEQRSFPEPANEGNLQLIASRDGDEMAIRVNQDIKLYRFRGKDGETASLPLRPSRKGWVQVVTGKATLGEMSLEQGDGVAIEDETTLTLRAASDTEILVFDLPE